jgi:hypothetical protein
MRRRTNSRDGNERLVLVHQEDLIRRRIADLIDGDMVICRLRGVVAVVWVEKIQEVDSEEIMSPWDRGDKWGILGLHREMEDPVIVNGNDEKVEVLGLQQHENRLQKSNMVVVKCIRGERIK